MNGVITNYAILAFEFGGKQYKKTVNRSEMDLASDADTWFWYFDEDGLHFEIWGGRDANGEPRTAGNESQIIPLAVNVYEVIGGYSEWIEQVDDIDVIECV